ncbi:acyltransferase [Seonamhaeicola sediminis]|uniref:Acyltransferase n=1 Tax=Seonamhaeicola sediminis TaxID=2528206 RepID=A0A562YH64_9FLAO|nr:acyltransferase [Seonamhaeicola sediminis]TWO34382.1 acyltransferase [Seonamhaeicola sediminis]
MKYIKGYDSLRAISILMVITSHLGSYKMLPNFDFIQVRVWSLISGSTGVLIFFTLSGFLITSILFEEKKHRGYINLKKFYIRRFLRLLPPLVIFYSIIILIMLFKLIKPNFEGLLLSIFYAYNFVPEKLYTVEIGHTWSLAVEEQFYITWPIIVIYLKKVKHLIYAAIIVVGLCLGFALVYSELGGFRSNFKPFRWFIPAVGPIMLGCLFSVLNFKYISKVPYLLKRNKLIFWMSLIFFLCPTYIPISYMVVSFIFQAVGVSIFLVWIYYNQNSSLVNVLHNKALV